MIGVIGPWNYPIFTPMGSIAYALAAGNAIVFKPSEYTPAVGQLMVDVFAEVVPEHPVLQIIHGMGDVGALLTTSGVDKIAFTGSTTTGKKIMAAARELADPGVARVRRQGRDDRRRGRGPERGRIRRRLGRTDQRRSDLHRHRAHLRGRPVHDAFVAKLVEKATALKVGFGDDSDIGPITMPAQIDTIRRHIGDAIERGGRAVLGGVDAVQAPYVQPTILVDVPEDSAAVTEGDVRPDIDGQAGRERRRGRTTGERPVVRAGRLGIRQTRRDEDRP